MFDRIMGRYLVANGKISEDQLSGVYKNQELKRAKMGVIAVTEKLMTVAQAEEINALQATMDKRFGDLAIDRGYLTNIQVGRLASMQEDEFLTFTSTVIERGIMSLEEINNCINQYQVDNNLTDAQMDGLKRGEMCSVAEIFIDKKDPEYISLLTYGIKNIYRLVDTHMSVEYARHAGSLRNECMSYQQFTGDVRATVALVGKDADMQHFAKSYTKEEFIETKEDALDAMCELINCINGLYATEKSKQGKHIDLEPPVFTTKFAEISGNDLHIIPVYSGSSKVDLVISVNGEVTVK